MNHYEVLAIPVYSPVNYSHDSLEDFREKIGVSMIKYFTSFENGVTVAIPLQTKREMDYLVKNTHALIARNKKENGISRLYALKCVQCTNTMTVFIIRIN